MTRLQQIRPALFKLNKGAVVQGRPFIITLHGVGEPLRRYEPGEMPYWISRNELDRVLDYIQRNLESKRIDLTVDDGNSSDYQIVAPELRKRGMHATFFVLAGRLDEVGYLSRSELRELSKDGFEVGSHGLNHVDWTNTDNATLEREVRDSKLIIEDVIGRSVTR